MERNFMGMAGMEKVVNGEARETCKDAAPIANSAVQWPFTNTILHQQQSVLSKATPEDRPKRNAFSQPASGHQFVSKSTMGAFDANHRLSAVTPLQKNFSINWQGSRPFLLPAYPSQAAISFDASVHHSNDARMLPMLSSYPIPLEQGNNFFKAYGSVIGANLSAASFKQEQHFGSQHQFGSAGVPSPVVGSTVRAFTPRTSPRELPTTAQLTIFYRGAVNAFDNVSFEQAQAIMSLAGDASNICPVIGNVRTQSPMLASGKVEVETLNMNEPPPQSNDESPCSGHSSPVSVTCCPPALSTSGSCTPDDISRQKTIGSSVPKSQQEQSKTILPPTAPAASTTLMAIAVPMARKASLARFLEKRKERMANAAPYLSTMKPTVSNVGIDAVGPTSKSTALDMVPSSTGEQYFCLRTPVMLSL